MDSVFMSIVSVAITVAPRVFPSSIVIQRQIAKVVIICVGRAIYIVIFLISGGQLFLASFYVS